MTENDHDSNEASADVWGTTGFVPGGDVGLVARHTVALIARDNPSTRERLWELVARDAPLDDVLDELSSTGLKALPDFGIAQTEGDAVRIVVRGRMTITVESSTGDDRHIEASDVRTWVEDVVREVVAITMTLPTDDHEPGPVVSANDVFAVLAGSVPASAITRRFDQADRHAATASSGSGWSATRANPDDAGRTEDVDRHAEVDSIESESGSDMSEIGAEQRTDPFGSSTQPPPSGTGTGAAPPPATSLFGDSPGASTEPADAHHDEPMGVGTDPDASSGEDGHQESPMPSDEPPVYAVLVFSSGERVSVDRTVLIGRNPKVDETAEGALPHLMKFDGPGQGLSRTHAEVRIDGGDLVLVDLESTNGTEVEFPGQPRRLLGADPVVIVPGTLIDFGDELHCTVEAAPGHPDV